MPKIPQSEWMPVIKAERQKLFIGESVDAIVNARGERLVNIFFRILCRKYVIRNGFFAKAILSDLINRMKILQPDLMMMIGVSSSFKDFVFNYVTESLEHIAKNGAENVNGKTNTKHS
jgi:hypothetical protein